MNPLSIGTVILYLAASVYQYLNLDQTRNFPEHRSQGYIICLLALLLHGATLYQGILHQSQLYLGLYNALSVTSFLVLVIILFTALKKPVLTISLFVMPFAALIVFLATLYPSQTEPVDRGLEIHILTSLVAYSLFTVAAIQALLLYYQDKKIRNKQVSFVLRVLPPLQLMEQLLVELMLAGFTLLTLSLISGVVFLEDIFAQHIVHKTALSVNAWLVFAVLLYGRFRHGWRGLTLTIWTVTGYISLLLAYFGSKFVLEILLN